MLSALRQFTLLAKETKNTQMFTSSLIPLLAQVKDSEDDFFGQILSMQVQMRQKALRRLHKQVKEIQPSAFRKAVLPVVDFIIFEAKSQLQNKRNTIRYGRE